MITLGDNANYFWVDKGDPNSTNLSIIKPSWRGRIVVLEFKAAINVSNQDTNSNLFLNGIFHASDGSTLTLISDRSNWRELSRSQNNSE